MKISLDFLSSMCLFFHMRNILIVDDDITFVNSLIMVFGSDYHIEKASTPEDMERIFAPFKYDVILLDIRLDNKSMDKQGIEILKEVKAQDPDIPVIMMTAYSDIETAVEALKIGAEDYIQKNKVALSDYKHIVDSLFREGKLRRRISKLQKEVEKYEPGEIIGKNRKIEEIRKQIRLVAEEGKTTVLILGETGTGKELVAKAIHRLGIRRDAPFVTVSLAALNKDTINSDLFGHEKGAFTGATSRRIGFLEEADGGVLFLDEIGDLDNDVQVKLLRVIENREFMRMGSNVPIKVDIQLVAATHRNLKKLIEENKFREDLYYRLKTYVIELPPLRERKDDIPLLAEFFLDQLKKQDRSTPDSLSDEALIALKRYAWPGNVRELKQAIENAALNARLSGDKIITLKDLKAIPREDLTMLSGKGGNIQAGFLNILNRNNISIAERVALFELKMVRETLIESGMKKQEVSKVLGYNDRFALRRRILAIFKKFPSLRNEFEDVFNKFVKK